MKKYSFRLDTVRRVRRAQEGEAKNELLKRNTAVANAMGIVATRHGEYEQSEAYLQTSVASIDAYLRNRYFNELSANALIAAKASLASAQAEAQVAKDLWMEATKKVRALDRLDEKAREEYLIEYNRAVTAETDDLVTGRWIRARAAQSRIDQTKGRVSQ